MARQALTDSLWMQLQVIMKEYGWYQNRNSREVIEGILLKLHTGAPWRDRPEELYLWKTVYNRFNRWSKSGLWENFFSLRKEIDTGWVFSDGSYIRCH